MNPKSNLMLNRAVLIALALFVVSTTLTKIAGYDVWWHLNLGRDFFETFRLRLPDSFTYTHAGLPQFNGELLADIIFYLSYDLFGITGLVLLKAGLVLAIAVLLYKTLMEGSDTTTSRFIAAAISIVIVILAIRFRFFMRPYLFAYLCFAGSLFLLHRYRYTRKASLLYLLPIIQIFWVNTSKGSFIGLVLPAIFLLSEFIEKRIDKKFLAAFCGIVAATFCNPEPLYVFRILSTELFTPTIMVGAVGEQRPLSAELLWGYGFHYTWAFQLIFFVSLIYFILFRGWKNPWHVLLFITFFIPTLMMIRMVSFFAIAAAVFFIVPLEKLVSTVCRKIPGNGARLSLSALLALLIGLVIYAPYNQTYKFGVGLKENFLPVKALDFIEKENISGRIFNSYPFGGYINWRNPEQKVYIDGRINHLFKPDFHKGYNDIMHTPAAWKTAQQEWGFTVAVLEYDTRSGGMHFPRHIVNDRDWALVYWDSISAVYLKQTEENRELINRLGYKIFKPTFFEYDYLNAYLAYPNQSELGTLMAREIDRSPGVQEHRLGRALFQYTRNPLIYRQAVLRDLEFCQQIEPQFALEYSLMAHIYLEMGNLQRAGELNQIALTLNPEDEVAVIVKKKLGQ